MNSNASLNHLTLNNIDVQNFSNTTDNNTFGLTCDTAKSFKLL